MSSAVGVRNAEKSGLTSTWMAMSVLAIGVGVQRRLLALSVFAARVTALERAVGLLDNAPRARRRAAIVFAYVPRHCSDLPFSRELNGRHAVEVGVIGSVDTVKQRNEQEVGADNDEDHADDHAYGAYHRFADVGTARDHGHNADNEQDDPGNHVAS